MKGCDHDVIYSGQTNLEQKFAYICRSCGECGWDSRYVLAQVNFEEFCAQRVRHGWQSPPYLRSGLSALALRAEKNRLRKRGANAWLFPAIVNTCVLVLLAVGCIWAQSFPRSAMAPVGIFGLVAVACWRQVIRGCG